MQPLCLLKCLLPGPLPWAEVREGKALDSQELGQPAHVANSSVLSPGPAKGELSSSGVLEDAALVVKLRMEKTRKARDWG
jgi:hypothetical protein